MRRGTRRLGPKLRSAVVDAYSDHKTSCRPTSRRLVNGCDSGGSIGTLVIQA